MARVGRPLKFENVDDLTLKVDNYFEETPQDEWTWTGIAMYLDTDKETLADYRDGKGERAEFSESLKRAMLKVENGYEIDLKKSGRTGTIFALKNFNWVDKQELQQTNLNLNKDVSDLSDEELLKLVQG